MNKIYSDQDIWGTPPASATDTVLSDEDIWGTAPATAQTAAAPEVDDSTWLTDLQTGWQNLKGIFAANRFVQAQEDREAAAGPIHTTRGPPRPATPIEKAQRLKTAREDEAEALTAIGKSQAAVSKLPQSPAAKRFVGAKTFGEAWDAFAEDPWAVTRSTTLQSLPASIPSIVGGIAGSILGPAGAAAGAGYGSYMTEVGSAVQEALQERGANLSDPKSILATWNKHRDEITAYAQTRAGIIGTADTLTAGVSSKIGLTAPAKQWVKGEVKRQILGTGVEALGSAAGEAAAGLATKGEIQPGQVLAEGLGEIPGGAVQVAGQTVVGRLAGNQAGTEPPPSGAGNVPPGAAPPPPPQGPRQEPRLFPQQPAAAAPPPGFELDPEPATPPPAAAPSEDAYLAGAGWTAEQIADMSPEERAAAVEEAMAQGVEPVDLSAGAPAPGTAPRAPRGTRAARQPIQTPEDLEAVRPIVNAEPTEGQKAAGNYQKGHIRIHGLDVSIENPRGSIRSGTDPDGNQWQSPELPADYGYIKGSKGKDGDHVDVYIGPNPASDRVFVIDQMDLKTGKFDEHKSVMGADDLGQAVDLYVNSFDDPTLDRIGDVTEMSVAEFKEWVRDGRLTKRPAAKAGIGTVTPNTPEPVTSVTEQGEQEIPELMPAPEMGIPISGQPDDFGAMFDEAVDERLREEPAASEQVEIRASKRGRATVSVPRYWYHSPRGRDTANGIKGYPLPPKETELAQMFPTVGDRHVYISPQPLSADAVKIDISSFADRVRLTSQSEGYAIVQGDIPASAIESPKTVPDAALSDYIANTRKPLTQEAFAKHAGIDVTEAGQALQRAQAQGRILVGRNGYRRQRSFKSPPHLLDYLSTEGIQDPTGELAGMDLPRMGRYGPIIRASGLHPDEWRERLIEDGYLFDPGWGTDRQQETTVADVYDLIARHMAGPPVYSTYDQAEADAIATTRAAENQNPDFVDAPLIERRYGTEAMAGVESFFAISGTTEADWSQQELDDAARMIAEGMDPGDAFERAAMMHVENVPEEIIIDPAMEAAFRRNDPNVMVAFDPIPFDDLTETTDATEQQPQEAGDGVREAGPEGDAAGSEGQTPFAAEQVRGAGEVRGEPGSEEPAAEEGVGFDPEDPVAAAREARKEAFSRYPGEDQYAERREFINGANSSIPGPFASNEAVNDPAALAAHKAGMEWAEANGVPRRDWTQAQWGYHVPEAYMPLYDVPQYGLTYRKRVARDRALWDLNEDLVEANRTKKKPDAAYEALMARRKGILQGAEDAYLDQPVTLDAPTPTIEPGAEGKPQLVIPGAEQDVKGAMQNAAQKPLKGKPGQKDMDIGLFGSERDQTDLFDAPKTPKTQEAKPNSVSDKPNSATTEDLGSMFDDAVDERFGEEETPVVKPSLTTPNRLVIQTGVVLRTKSGRETSPAPKIEATNDRKTLNTIKRMNQWLLDEARKEVEGDDWQTQLLRGIDVNNLSRSDQDQINLVLFGDPDGATEDNVVRVETGKKPKTATQAAASAVKNTAMGLEDVAKGLSTLFGGKNKLSSGFTFDEDTYRQAIPFFKAGVAHFAQAGRDFRAMMKALVDYLASAGMDRDALTAMRPYAVRFMEDIRDGKESLDAPGSSEVLEPDRGDADAGDGVGAADVPASAGGSGPGARSGGRAGSRAGGRGPRGGRSLPPSHAPVVGEGGNLELPAREPEPLFSNPPDTEPVGSPADGGERLPDDRIPALDAIEAAAPGSDLESRKRAQKAAESIPVKLGDIDNIRQTLPLLHPEQQDDVRKVEERYSKPDGHGMLLTNGTGTGKTFSGLGVVKRFAKQGKTNILIVAPSKGILEDWQKAAKNFGLDVSVLESTQDKGNGIVATTYANLGQNPTLADRKWDLVVTDESHKLSSDANGTATSALEALRAISLHPDGMYRRGQMVFRKEWDRATALKPPEKGATREQVEAYEKALDEWRAKYDAARPGWQAGERGKVLMLSATPFAYHFSLDYAEGYLFTYPEVGSRGGYNQPGPRDQFYIENFGYRMRTGKLTKPDADVRSEVMERQFHEKLKKSGSLSGRALEVEKDYDRKFILVESGIGKRIDEALKFLREADDRKFLPLYDIVSKQFDYLTQLRLLEAIKAQAAIPYIKKSIALGRKVVVFHDYNEGGGISPFEMSIPEDLEVTVTGSDGKQKKVKPAELYREFHARNPWVKQLKFGDYPAPIVALQRAFPNALIYNGTVPEKKRSEAKTLFNTDNNGYDVIVVQSAAGEAGISLHDITNVHQRALLNLGLPPRPMTALQQEGRIYRVGQASDALFRYMNTGTDWERWAFSTKMATRSGTAENLAMGDQARTIRQSFIDAYEAADDYEPTPGEGTGGKAIDRANNESLSEYEKAKTHYFAQGKNRKRRDQREGIDYFATPEPLGLKMVEWANVKPGEKILEPSAGHGAISRYFPEDTARTIVEPSSELASRASLTSPGARVVMSRFEDLDVVNKFDAIVMNPPFGTGAKTAIEHIEKASRHLKNGGRIVALIPRGGMADKRFSDWYDNVDGVYLVGNILLPPVTFERAGTSVAARVVILEKQTDKDVRPQEQRERDYSSAETINEFFDRIEDTDMGQRVEPKSKDVDAPTQGEITVDGITFNLNGTEPNVYADLKSFVPSRFRSLAQAAEANGGSWLRSIKAFAFKTVAQRQAFLDRVANPPPEEAAPAAGSPTAPGAAPRVKTTEVIHAKTGKKLFVATLEDRVSPEEYQRINAIAKKHSGYYSSFKGRGAVPGFQFPSEDARIQFMAELAGPPEASLESRTRAADVTQTEAFRNWFGGSKVVDEAGAPLVVYHGTGQDFDRFDVQKVGTNHKWSRGFYFAGTPRAASEYANTATGARDAQPGIPGLVKDRPADAGVGGANIMPVYLALKNPLVKRARGYLSPDQAADRNIDKWIAEAKSKGYDGLVIKTGEAFKDRGDIYVAFDPTQIKSATGNRGTFDPNRESILESRAQAPVFYSALLRAVEGMKQQTGTKAQWMGMIRNAPGVKPEELKWIGLEDFLLERPGGNRPTPVTKQELVDFIKANQVEVQEVVKSRDAPAGFYVGPFDVDTEEGRWVVTDINGERVGPRYATRAEAEVALEEVNRNGPPQADGADGPTKFHTYQLPGGENYRELLLTLPVDRREEIRIGDRGAEMRRTLREKYGERYIDLMTEEEYLALSKIDNDALEAETEANRSQYKSSHFDEPNILAHVRFNERTDADGRRVLFIEEIQSDWHQTGRKKGYKKPVDIPALVRELPPGWTYHRKGSQVTLRENGEFRGARTVQSWEREDQIRDKAIDLYNSIARGNAEAINANTVPDAPFKGAAWPELAMKRMIRWAAENGFDRIAWTPGEVQAERYDLSKQISKIEYEDNFSGGIGLPKMDGPPSRGELRAYDLSGARVIREVVEDPAKVADYVGKEAAEKLFESKPTSVNSSGVGARRRVLSGLDLKVGGKGMIGFYDKILVDTANKLGKKWGTKVSRASLPIEDIEVDDREVAAYHDLSRSVWNSMSARERAQYRSEFMKEKVQQPTFHSLDIPPAMAAAAMEGQPLFTKSATKMPKGIPEQRLNPYRFIITEKQQAEMMAEIRAITQRILGRHIRKVNVVDDQRAWNSIFGNDVDGSYDPNRSLIYLALQGLQDPRSTLRHEAIHALRKAGVFTEREWAVLSKLARERWIEQYNIRRRYSHYPEVFDLTPAQIEELMIEEAIADAMADHWRRPTAEDVVGRIMGKVKDLLEAIRNYLRGQGFQTVDQILERVESGEVAARQPGSGQGRGFLLRARQESRAEASLESRSRQQPPRNPAPGSFDAPHDERVRRALFDSTDTLLNRIRRAGKAASIEGLRKLQDREIDLLRTQMAIEEASGPISEPKNAYLAASLYPGRVAQRDSDLVEDFVEPLIEDIASRGLTLEEVDEFNMARHAFERNLEVGKLHKPGTQFHEAMTNPAIVGASGLSDNEASDILNRFQAQGKLQDLEAVGDQIVALNRRTLTSLLNEGLITQDQYDGLTAKYQFYVPLRGFDDVTDEANPETPRTGRRFDVRGREYQQAFGRTSKADSPLAYSIMQARQALIRIEKNRVGKRFLRLAQQNPNEEFWQINRIELKKVIDPNTGYVRNVFDRGAQEAENVFAVKVGGKRYNITLHHEGLLRAMKGIGGENMHGAFAFLHRITRFLAAVRTQYNPEFIFTNFMRDLQQAGIVLSEEQVAGLKRQVLANLPKAMAGMNRMLNGDISTTWARYAREFANAGGKIGFMERNDIDAEKRALEQMLSDANPSLGRKAWLKFMEHTIERIDRYNDVVENTMRLSAYVGMRQAGASQDRAASVARELTVNFNRKGEWGPQMNALFMFFNASTQGMSNFALRLYRSPLLRKVFIGLMVYGFLQSMLNRMLAGDDEDDENRWNKIPMTEKQRNHIIMLPKWLEDQFGVPYFKIPAPLSWNLPMIIGMQVEHGVLGDLSPLEVGSNILGAFGDAFNPLGSGGTWANFITPTIGDPIVDIAQNRNFFGEEIVPRQFDETTPFAERHSPNIAPVWKALTDTLSSMTGGSPERAGSIDWSPEWVEHIWEFTFGGLGSLVSRTMATTEAVRQGEELDATKVPFARVFVGRDARYADREQYFQIRDAVHVTEKELEARLAEGNREAAARIRQERAREVQMIGFMNSAEKRMAKLRKEYKAVKNHLKMGEETKRERLDRLRQQMDDIQLKVRTRWNRLEMVGKTVTGVGAN